MAGLPVVRTGDVALDRFLEAVREYIESSKGGGSAASQRVLRMSDLPSIVKLVTAAVETNTAPSTQQELESLAVSLSNTRVFKALTTPGSAVADVLEGYTRETLSDVRKVAVSSTAAATTEAVVSATQDQALAAQVTTVQASLTGVQGNLATVETAYLALANRATGLEAQYTIKVTAGGAIAGIGLAATQSNDGNTTSAVIIRADRFAIVNAGYSAGGTTSPPTWAMPFTVDTVNNKIVMNSGVQINGNLLVDGTVGANAIGANTLTAVSINTTGSVRATGSYLEGSFSFQGANFKTGGVFQTTGSGVGYFGNWLAGCIGYVPSGNENAVGKFGLVGLHNIAGSLAAVSGGSGVSGGVAGVTDIGSAVYGYASGNGSGLVGQGVGATSYSLQLLGTGRVLWGGLPISPPPNSSTVFLRGDGQWAAASGGSSGVSSFNSRTGAVSLTSTDVTNALGFSPVSSSGSVAFASNSAALNGYGPASWFRYVGYTTAPKTFAGYAQIEVSGSSAYYIPIYQ